MQDIRTLFDEKKYFLKIPIFYVDTAIRKFSKFPHFLPIFDLQRAFEILYIDTCKLIFQKLGLISFHLKKNQVSSIKIRKIIKISVEDIFGRRVAKIGVFDVTLTSKLTSEKKYLFTPSYQVLAPLDHFWRFQLGGVNLPSPQVKQVVQIPQVKQV